MGVLTLSDIKRLPELEWVVQDLIPKKGIGVLGGPPKEGKSRLVLSSLLDALDERPFLGHFTNDVVTSLIYNAEGGHQGIRARSSMYDHMSAGKLVGIRVQDECAPLVSEKGVDMAVYSAMLQTIVQEQACLFVLDPLVRFHACDENDNAQMTQVMAAIRRLAEESGSGALIVHHTSKPPNDMSQGELRKQGGAKLRGASAIFAEADSVVMAYPLKGGLHLGFECRYAAPVDDYCMASCSCQEDGEGCGRFYKVVDGPQKSRFGDPGAWQLDHTDCTPSTFARAWGTTVQVAEEVLQ